MGARQYRENIIGIEGADTIIILQSDLDRLLTFVKKVAVLTIEEVNTDTTAYLVNLINEAQLVLEKDNQKNEWQK